MSSATASASTTTSRLAIKRPLVPKHQISFLSLPPLLNDPPAHLLRQRPRSPSPVPSTLPQTSILRPKTKTPSLLHQLRTMSTAQEEIPAIIAQTRAAASGIPGEQVEPRQTLPTEDMEPNPANSIPLPPNRQRLIDDVIALYSCQPTVERVARYSPGKRAHQECDMCADDV